MTAANLSQSAFRGRSDTGSVDPATFTASIAGTIMTVTAISIGAIWVGGTVTGTSVAANTTIVSQISGTLNGTGTYLLSSIQGTIGSNTLTETPTWIAAASTNWTQVVGVPFRVRFLIQNTTTGTPSATTVQLQANLNGGAFQNVTTASTVVQATSSASTSPDEAAINTPRLAGTGTFTPGHYSADGVDDTGVTPVGSGNTEWEFGLILGSGIERGNTISLKVTTVSGSTITATTSPTITVATPVFNVPILWPFSYDVAESNWYPAPGNCNADALPLLTAVKFFGAGGQAPTKRWNPNYNCDDFSYWQGNGPPFPTNLPIASTIEFPPERGGLPNTPDDEPVWQVRLHDESSAVLQAFSQPPVFGAGGQVPTKLWRWDEDGLGISWRGPPGWYNAYPLTLPTSPFKQPSWNFGYDEASNWRPQLVSKNQNLSAAVTNPFEQKQWLFGYEDSSGWQYPAPFNFSLVSNFQLPSLTDWTPSPPDDSAFWVAKTAPQASALLIPTLTAGGQIEFRREWLFGNEDPSGWQSVSKARNPNLVPVATTTPFVPLQLSWSNSDDLPAWQFIQPYNLINALTKNVLRPPFIAPRPGDESYWQSYSTGLNLSIVTLPVVVNNPFASVPWRFNSDDPSGWQYQVPFNSLAVLNPQFEPPLIEWVPSPPDDSSYWQGTPFSANVHLTTAAVTPFIYIPWKFGQDDASFWQGSPTPKNIHLTTPAVVPFIYIPWKFGQDDSSYWVGSPIAKNIHLTAAAITPFIYIPWKFGQDDSSFWQGAPVPKNLHLTTPAVTPFIYIPWKFGQDDSSGWQGQPQISRLLVPTLTAEGQVKWEREWLFGYDDPAYQGGAPVPSRLLVPELTVGQVKNQQWLFGNDDPPSWSPILARQAQLLVLPPAKPPIIPGLWRFGNEDPAVWSRYYFVGYGIHQLIVPLEIDPRYICAPNAPTPSNAGAGRTFVTNAEG